MARIDELITQITDKELRRKLETALADVKRRQRFGLVFEEHVPETTGLLRFPVTAGATVQRKSDADASKTYQVKTVNRSKATIELEEGGLVESVATKDLLVIKRFGDPIFPALTSLGAVLNGPTEKPHHAVVNGENFHALQLFVYLYESSADCIYIDPPYNTGAKDWKYNNRYVDSKDSWRHSKWLGFMEKRLRLAKQLLKPDGVLIVTIDEHEVHHLGMLLEKTFPDHQHYMITIVINPKGREKANFAPVEEYAFFVVPRVRKEIILRASSETPVQETLDDEIDQDYEDDAILDETDPTDEDEDDLTATGRDNETWEYRHARRRGGGAESSSYREKRWGQFYPIFIDEKKRIVVRAGEPIPLDQEPNFTKVGGLRPLWPIDTEGRHRVWGFIPSSMQGMIDKGNVLLGKYHVKRDDWTVNYRVPRKNTRKLKTVWWAKAHDAGTHGTELLKKFLGRPGIFPFPKSVYAVKDCIAAVVGNRPNALIIDFFGGSGTTFHATCMLNAEDLGNRRSITVTNNEVAEKLANKLQNQGIYRGDPRFEKHGIFEEATRPRCAAVVLGKRADGIAVPGRQLNVSGKATGRPFSEGFKENVEFFRLDYLDPDDIDLGTQFHSILPSLWLASGGIGRREDLPNPVGFAMPLGCRYAVLFEEKSFRKFRKALESRTDVTHIWIVTDSEDAFAEMRSILPSRITTSMLYRDYLRNFRINTRHNL